MRHAAEVVGVEALLPAATEAVNNNQLDELERRVLAEGPGTIGIAGLAFKPGTDVVDGSVAYELALRFVRRGHALRVYDELVPPGCLPGSVSVPTVEQLVDECRVILLANGDPTLAQQVSSACRASDAPPTLIDPWCLTAARLPEVAEVDSDIALLADAG